MSAKEVIGLSWEPKLPGLSISLASSSSSATLSASKGNTVSGLDVRTEARPESTSLYKPDSELVDGLFVPPNNPRKLNKLLKKQVKDTAGSSWFDMPAPTITPELKKDLQLLKLRSVIDPKRFYKKGDSTTSKYFQIGTVVESAEDYFSSRLSKKERKSTLADELLSDHALKEYRKRKVREIEKQNKPAPGNQKWKIRGRQTQKRAKQRR